MDNKRRVLGIIASDLCKNLPRSEKEKGKPWFHIRRFIKDHYDVLARYDLMATDGTAKIIRETCQRLKAKPLYLEEVGPRFWGIVKLAAMVAEGGVERVLFFEDPDDVEVEHPENYALLRNCDMHGKPFMINEAAHLWAEFEAKRIPAEPRRVRGKLNGEIVEIPETVVLIAQDKEKQRMAKLLSRYSTIFSWFPRLLATSGTKDYIDEFLEGTLPQEKRPKIESAGHNKQDKRGAKGGDVIVVDEIFRVFRENPDLFNEKFGPLYHVLFFVDHKEHWAPTLDTRVLMRAFANPMLRVNLLFNSRMAEEWIIRFIEP